MKRIIKLHVTITIIGLFCISPALAQASALTNFLIRSYLPDSSTLAYSESFRLLDNTSNSEQQGIATYTDPSGDKLAIKRFTFQKHLYQPNFKFEDYRDGYTTSVIRNGESFRVSFKESQSNPLKEKTLKIPEPVVVDFGIHFFVLSEWDKLIAGEDVQLTYVVPKNLDYYRMVIGKIQIDEGNIKTQVVFKLRPKNPFLNLISNVVSSGITFLTYDVETKKFLQYNGVSLIRDVSGKNYSVRSVYHYD